MALNIASSIAFGDAFRGEIAALTAAFLWAAATLMFGQLGKQLAPVVLNLVKGAFAITFILLTLLLRAQIKETPINLSFSDIFYLLLSGGIGIGLGDTAYFAAINALGARRALLLETLAPPMAAILAWAFLGEQLSWTAMGGIGCTLAGIVWVICERSPKQREKPNQTKAGLSVAMLAVFCQASGVVLSRGVLAGTTIDPLLSALIRLVAGMIFITALVLGQPWRLGAYSTSHSTNPDTPNLDTFNTDNFEARSANIKNWRHRWHNSLMALKQPSLLVAVAIAALLGTYLGIWLQQIALKHTATGIAQALLATSPLFVLPMAALLGDHISYRATLGAVIALSGVWILLAS
ncbi:MAG: DMT family transporter [Cyanobacteria bacterium P01_D01_bin.105]